MPVRDLLTVRTTLLEQLTPPAGAAGTTTATTIAEDDPAALALLDAPDLLGRVAATVRALGYAGGDWPVRLVYLVLTSRLLPRPLNLVFSGPSSAGKSFTYGVVTHLFPPEATYFLSGMSDRVLAYTDVDLRHTTLIIGEASALQRDGIGASLLRNIAWEGRLGYETVERTADGIKPRRIEKPGPTGFITTTTGRVEPELETRVLTVAIDDTPQATRTIIAAIASHANGHAPAPPDLAPWHAAQGWLVAHGDREVTIPFENTTIRVQIAECTRELERVGVAAEHWHTDENVDSELEMGDRPAGGRLMRDALAGNIRTLLVWKFDRLGRGFAMLDALNRLKKACIAVRSLKEPTTFSETPEGWMFCHILAGVGGFEKASIRTRIIGGQETAIRDRGRFTGGAAPYGYEKTPARTIAPRHEPIPGTALSEVDVIRLIYAWLVDEGIATTRIAARLTEMDIPQRSHYRPTPQVRARPAQLPWSPARIHAIVSNTTYKGEWTWGKHPLPHNAGRETIILPVEPLVSPLVWEAAQEALRANGRTEQRHARYDYLLSGLIACGCCGLSFGGKTWQGKLPYYRCTAKQGLHGPYGRRGEKCPSLGIRADKLDALVWADIRQFAEEIGPTLAEVRAAYAARAGDAEAIRRRIEAARADLTGKVGERDIILALFRQGRIPASALDTQLAQIAGEEEALNARIAALEAERGTADELAARLTEAEAVLHEMRTRLDAIEASGGRAAVVRKLVKGVTVWTREIDGKRQPVAEVEYLFRKGGPGQTGSPGGHTKASTPSSPSRTLAATSSSSIPACRRGRTPTMATPTGTA